MELVRLYISQDNARRFLDVPPHLVAEAQVEVEMAGGAVYHMSVLPKTRKMKRARLNKRLY